MIHEILPVGPLQCNCSVIGDETSREAIVIDPGDDIDDILALVAKHHLRVKQLVITHAHIDHVDAGKAGSLTAEVLHTPGHTEGSICLYFPAESKLIAGDTLFAGSIGRTDLPGGSYDKILRSLHDRVLALPDDTIVVPGHGLLTTIGEERDSNPFLQKG